MSFITKAEDVVHSHLADKGLDPTFIQVSVGAAIVAAILAVSSDPASSTSLMGVIMLTSLYLTDRFGVTEMFANFVWQTIGFVAALLVVSLVGVTMTVAAAFVATAFFVLGLVSD